MTNPTSNFGWQMPQPSDLVTDLPADFETFGQAVDTSLADLKGGTTGQVLSKASNTDMDFTWVAQDDSNAIQNAIVDAKGDLIAASAADTPARLAVGNNGETLVADSSTATGLRYNPITGNLNSVINGGFDIWQRGTSFSGPGTGVYLADRWMVQNSGVSPVISQQTTGAPNGSRYVFRAASGGTGSFTNIATMLETSMAQAYWGNNATLQVKLRRNASFATTITVYLQKSATVDAGNGATWTSIATTTITNANLPTGTGVTDWVTATVSGAVPNDGTANSLRVLVAPDATFGSGAYWEMAQVKLEIGSVATAFTRTGGSIQGELDACCRYYEKNQGAIYSTAASGGLVDSYANAVYYKAEKRVQPTLTIFSSGNQGGTSGSATWYGGGSGTVAAAAQESNTETQFVIRRAGVNTSTFAVFSYTSSAEL